MATKSTKTARNDAKQLEQALKIAKLPRIDLSSVKEVALRVQQYFDICQEAEIKPSISGLALAMGVTRRRLWEMRERAVKGKDISELLIRATQIIETVTVGYLSDGQLHPTTGIFMMTNDFGYENYPKQPIVQANSAMGELPDMEALARRIQATLPEPEQINTKGKK